MLGRPRERVPAAVAVSPQSGHTDSDSTDAKAQRNLFALLNAEAGVT
jgi:hypothetical protein